MIAIAVMVSAVIELVDTSAVNVSLPYMAGNLSSSVDEATWVQTSCLVANAVILPLSGWLANYFGPRRLLIISVVGFTITSILCGLAPTLTTLVFFRIPQGAASLVASHGLPSATSGLRAYLMQQGDSSARAAHQALALIYHQLVEQAATLSYLDGFRVMAILLLVAAPIIWIMKKPHFKSPSEGAA